MNVTAINVFIQSDGKESIAMINPEYADLFMLMLPTFQTGQPKQAHLYVLPPSVEVHVDAARAALHDVLMKPKGK